MSFDHLTVRDVEGEHRYAADQLPLRVGTGADADLRLPGPGGGAVFLLDILDGEPFVQPVGRDAAVELNGEPLVASRRLADGDELSFYGSRIAVTADERLVLDVRLEDSAYVTRPPEQEEAGEAADEEIAPTRFRRATEAQPVVTDTGHHRVRNAIIAGLVLLAFASWLLFTAKSVKFIVEPVEPDAVAIEGAWFKLPIGDRVLLRRGEYTLLVEKAGYYDVRQNFVVGDAQTQNVTVSLRRRPGSIVVRTEPPDADATVMIDEVHVGPAPLGPVELQPGDHSVSVTAERFLPFSDIIEFPGLGREIVVNVQLVPRWAEVSITSEPAGATIYAGDERVGETPAVIELIEGSHQLSVVREGFKAWDGSVSVEPNSNIALPPIRLEEADAKLRVQTIPRSANVLVNGRYRGQSPITLDLAPGIDYEIGLSKAGYGRTTRKVRLESAASESITVDLSARTGTVAVEVSPRDATVYVNGRARGTGSVSLELAAAPQTIEVRREGYQTWTRSVTPRPGYPQTLTARLRSEEEIARAQVATFVEAADGTRLRRVEPGSFTMGASRSVQGRRANEVLVPVRITQPFYISVHELTNKAFAEFAPDHNPGADVHPALAGDNNPVANVSWRQAVEYCNWLSKREGLDPVYEERFGEYEAKRPLPNGYRLPTEAEWAWALRYGATDGAAKFSWGDQWPPRGDAGNYADRSAADLVPTIIPNYDDGFASTAPVGSFPANGIGLHDAGGNVAEWVNDFYSVPTPGLTEPVVDPLGPDRGTARVIRGSSWKHAGITELRLSYRDYGSEARNDVGFRIVRSAD